MFYQPKLRFYPDEIAYDSAHLIKDGPERNTKEISGFAKAVIENAQKLK